ncbi:MAG: DUF1232 domain-containing protein [Nitrospinaceae bacterium]|nr:DUF1232 domain-containing protein [Nitrospinaceae bacterium]NIR53513.1 DUF1232 domain-containing protein [Nitrospinaceae bacterium]NIS83912.1 DUF1232 domain-containing protein [Nitrospinaceae bacterium]NIT80720.1 DUF1232 domain-containing protein [Nitrospinaceae bacterium]NIU43029.1 DUF1232 domain-containing protein [Nitrospinaceae bacterium]
MIKDILVALAGLVSLLYLTNPTAGLFELIPDNFPIIGNLDEAAACAVILAAFRYYGIDLTSFLGRGIRGKKDSSDREKDPESPSS